MYDIARLEQLAAEPDFVAEVRRTAVDLMALATASAPTWVAQIGPLLRYGPRQAGSLLRFTIVPQVLAAAALHGQQPDEQLVQRTFRIIEQMETTES